MRTRHFLPLIGLVFLVGCAGLRDAGPDPPESQQDILIQPRPEDEDEITREESEELFDPDALGAYDVATIQAAEFTNGEEIELSLFSRARMFAAVVETLELTGAMSSPQRERLYNSLFNGIPARLIGTYRAIAIGDFFSSGEPLYILLGVVEPTDRAPRGTDRTFLLQTSALSDHNRVATYEFGRLVDLTVNVSFIYHISVDGVAREAEAFSVPARPVSLRSETESPDTAGNARIEAESQPPGVPGNEHGDLDRILEAGSGPMPELLLREERIRLARRIVETTPPARAREVPRLVDPLTEDTGLPLRLRAEALYTRFLYNLSVKQKGRAEETAERLYFLLEESYESESEYMTQSLAYRVEHVIPIMLETYEYDLEDSDTFNQPSEAAGEQNGG